VKNPNLWAAFISVLMLTSCSEPRQEFSAENVVGTIVAYTLEEYRTQPVKTKIPEGTPFNPVDGVSIEVTQQSVEKQEHPVETAVDIPDSYHIWNIWGHRQYLGLGCESSAVVDWADYFGVRISEFTFQVRLPLSDNPDKGFVGSVEGPWGQVPPYAYGVHAGPIAEVLREHYDMNAEGVKDFSIDEIKRELSSGEPVIAWVIGNCVCGIPYEYIDSEGDTVMVAVFEHVVILTGYDEKNIRYMNNGKFYDIPYENFSNTWSVLGNMVVYLSD